MEQKEQRNMFSRVRTNVTHFFECFCEIVPPSQDRAPWILQQFPDKYSADVLNSVPQFAYPCTIENTNIQHFTFVLTDAQSKFTFGFCRHDPKSETALVVLSLLPWHQAFYKFLDNIGVLMHSSRAEDLREFLVAVYTHKLADPGKPFSVPFHRGSSTFTVETPQPFQLPSIPEDRNLTEYYNAIEPNNMITIFASMLYERRIVITSAKLKRLSACVQSANDLIYPMLWQHIFIPVLPMNLMGCLLAPMPFLIGVPEEVWKKVNRSELGDVVILDADTNKLETPFDDLNHLPHDVIASLKKQLKNRNILLGDGVSRSFLQALVKLIGGYRDALKMRPGQKVDFDEESFIETRPLSSQPFLREMLNLQIFQQFIEERLEMFNNGTGFSDAFEQEVCLYSEKSSSTMKHQYKEWASSMKKEGSAFIKSVKDKANPAVKSAVKTVKDGGKGMKGAYKEFKMKLKDNQSPHQLRNGLDKIDKPRSAPNSPTGKRRSLGFGNPTAAYLKDTSLAFKSSGSERPYSPLSPMSPDTVDQSRCGSPTLDIPKIDLVNEMEDYIKNRYETPPVDRTLKPVRSLENFNHSNHIHTHTLPTGGTLAATTTTTLPSPDRWLFPSRISAPALSPTSRLFHAHKPNADTQNLLQSPDDVFSPPPIPQRSMQDLFGGGGGSNTSTASPFVVGGGRENGQSVFLLASQHTVDVVRLHPPSLSPYRKKVEDDTQDLIRLDSSSDMDEFDPLKSYSSATLSDSSLNCAPISILNPLYDYENHSLPANGVSTSAQHQTPAYDSKDQVLLAEYGLDKFAAFENFDTSISTKAKTQSQWAKFE